VGQWEGGWIACGAASPRSTIDRARQHWQDGPCAFPCWCSVPFFSMRGRTPALPPWSMGSLCCVEPKGLKPELAHIPEDRSVWTSNTAGREPLHDRASTSGCAAYFMLSWARWRDSSVVLLDVSRSHSDRRSGTLTGPWYNTHNLSVIRRIPDDNRVGDRQNVTATKHMKQGPHPS